MNCPNCHTEFTGTTRSRTCGRPECVEWWRTVGRYQDLDAYDRHKLAKARTVLRNPEKYGYDRVRRAEDILAEFGD